ncbi:LysR family transcriptional regulator [Muricoccus pecuniae]|uniref:DNA-binding transcriptional LysR family regulator n=1 Tax=Muricoccus pecuniae TaxID=693023 RepID=A0A840YIT7_9PROT|nr:LysR family transcriptional regulator [Roseomonas pecuniae]MBB5693854.1 DNA-binding transcriptional LysR family regulator [Roseomonas pecuniae]
MSVTLRQMRAIVAVARTGSLGRAAKLLHLSQPALTVQLREAEAALGLRLFDRGARGAVATVAGRGLADAFARVLEDLDAVVAGAREAAAGRSGLVRVAVLPSVGATLLPPVLARLRAANPGIRIVVRDAVARNVVQLVRTGAVEIGIGTEIERDPEIEVVPILEDRMVAVLPSGHRFEALPAVAVAELAGEALVLMDPESSVRALFDRACREAGVSPLPACEATYMSTAVALVRAGLGIGVLPSSAVDLRVTPILQTRPIVGPEVRRSISLVRRAGRTLSPAAEALVGDILAGIRGPGLRQRRRRPARTG